MTRVPDAAGDDDSVHDPVLDAAIAQMIALEEDEIQQVVAKLSRVQRRAIVDQWSTWGHGGQKPTRPNWRTWLIQAGRGFGKTRAGAEWVSAQARANPRLRVALVGATIAEVEAVMVRGDSGLMRVAREHEDIIYVPSRGVLTFANGALAFAYSGANPDKLRGPEHHIAWCDEIAKWRHPDATWDNLLLTMRGGDDPRIMVTTTPRAISLMRRIRAHDDTMVTGGATGANPHLSRAFVDELAGRFRGTRIGRQEVNGELIEDAEGALWTRAMIEASRGMMSGEPARVVVGVDPPASAEGDACGIVVAALCTQGLYHVLADASAQGLSPEGWARAVAAAAEAFGADRVVAEKNQGGDMVGSVLKAADCTLPVKLVHARRGKSARAEPVAALFEAGKARLGGSFPDLEDQLCGMLVAGLYVGPGRSPDRADAMVWALTELMQSRRGSPGLRRL